MTILLDNTVPALYIPITMSLIFWGSSSLKILGLPDFFMRVFSLLLLHFIVDVITEVGFKSYLW